MARKDTIYIDHINNRWEAHAYNEGRKFNTGVHRTSRLDLICLLHSQGYEVIDITNA